MPQTLQELFDRSVSGLLAQKARSMDPCEECCEYRGVEGRKCAIGFLIPDDLYHDGIEGVSITALDAAGDEWYSRTGTVIASALAKVLNDAGIPADPKTRQVLQDLQSIHDDFSIESWPHELHALAETHGLEWRHG